MLRLLKQKLRRARMTADGIREELTRERVTLGNPGAEWTLCPDALGPDSVIYSIGAGGDISFDLALIERFKATVHVFDPTPRSIEWIRTLDLPAKLRFHEYGLAHFDGAIDFYPPKKRDFS